MCSNARTEHGNNDSYFFTGGQLDVASSESSSYAAKEARINRDRVTEPLLPGGGNGPSSPGAAYSDVARWTSMAQEKAPTSPRVKEKRRSGGSAGSAAAPGPAASQASAAPLDTTEDLAALLGVTVEPVATHEGGSMLPEEKLPLQAAEGFYPTHVGDIPASLSSGSPMDHSGPLQASLAPVATGGDAGDSPQSQEDAADDGAASAPDAAAGKSKFRSPRAGSAADVAAAFSGVNTSSGLNNTTLRRDTAAAAFDPVDTASQRASRQFGNTISDENNTSVSISKLVGMLKARTAAPNLGETFAGRGAAASWKPGSGLSGAAISGSLKNGGAEKTSPAKRGSGGTSQRWGPGAAPLSTNNFDGAASSDDEPDMVCLSVPCDLILLLTFNAQNVSSRFVWIMWHLLPLECVWGMQLLGMQCRR